MNHAWNSEVSISYSSKITAEFNFHVTINLYMDLDIDLNLHNLKVRTKGKFLFDLFP